MGCMGTNMAHQVHNIPWTTLSSCLTWRLSNRCEGGAADLHLNPRRDRGKKLTHFTTAFARNIHEHAECEIRKHADDNGPPPAPDEVVVDDDTAALIAPIIKRWRQFVEYRLGINNNWLGACSHQSDGCGCVLPRARRKMAAFTEVFHAQDCYSHMHVKSSGFFNLEVFTAMLLHGQMQALFRICSHPEVALQTWWEERECQCSEDFGWFRVSSFALDAYILLNVLLHFPQTWQKGQADYRRLKTYQEVVYRITKASVDELPAYPHRRFFGIVDDQFKENDGWDSPHSRARWLRPKSSRRWRDPEGKSQGSVLGHIPYEAFVDLNQVSEYLPSSQDVSHVRWILCKKGLPTEVANMILQEARYHAQRRHPVPDDPLHSANSDELRKYLTYNWQLITRSAALGARMGMQIDWEQEVARSLLRLFGCSCKNHETPSLIDYEASIDWDASRHGIIKFL